MIIKERVKAFLYNKETEQINSLKLELENKHNELLDTKRHRSLLLNKSYESLKEAKEAKRMAHRESAAAKQARLLAVYSLATTVATIIASFVICLL